MNYSEAREYLKNVNKLGSILGLNTIKELLKRLGNPQNELKVVHIAGTNGKGSIMTFVQNILMESGYKVGRYCSPAVFNEREIIRINDEYISEEQSADLLTRIKEKCDSMYSEGLPHPTSFEIETAEALMFFKEQNCDIALIECGMGGETDATNVFEKVLCSVIATISLDHTQFLGSTIEEITKVKLLAASLEVFCSIEKIEGERIQDAFSNLGHMIFDMEPIVKIMEPLNIGDVVFRKEGSVKILGTLKKIKGETAYILPYGMPFDSDKLIELKHRYRNLEKLV